MRTRVDLPQPDGPNRARISLGWIARLRLASSRNGLPLGSVKTCDTSRSSHRLSATAVSSVAISGTALFAQRESGFGELVKSAPDQAVEQHHHAGHYQHTGG